MILLQLLLSFLRNSNASPCGICNATLFKPEKDQGFQLETVPRRPCKYIVFLYLFTFCLCAAGICRSNLKWCNFHRTNPTITKTLQEWQKRGFAVGHECWCYWDIEVVVHQKLRQGVGVSSKGNCRKTSSFTGKSMVSSDASLVLWTGLSLVGGLEHEFYFSHHIGNVIIPTDELHHFSEG